MKRTKKPNKPAPASAAISAADLATFLDLSSVLTGFSQVELEGAGTASTLATFVAQKVGQSIWNEVVAAARLALNQPDPAAAIKSGIWASPKLGPVVQNLVLFWYVGSWPPMPRPWQEQYNWSNPDLSTSNEWLPSPLPYEESLVWRAIYAHPPGAKPTGFASWTEAPEEVRQKLISLAAAGGKA